MKYGKKEKKKIDCNSSALFIFTRIFSDSTKRRENKINCKKKFCVGGKGGFKYRFVAEQGLKTNRNFFPLTNTYLYMKKKKIKCIDKKVFNEKKKYAFKFIPDNYTKKKL